MMIIFQSGISILVCLDGVFSLNILSVEQYTVSGHHAVFEGLMRSLVTRGHNVTVLNGFPSVSTTNYTHIDLSAQLNSIKDFVTFEQRHVTINPWHKNKFGSWFEKEECEKIISSSFIHDLFKSETRQFDVMLIESLQIQGCLSISERLDMQLIWLTTFPMTPAIDFSIGNPLNPSYYPIVKYKSATTKMNFRGRLENTIEYIISQSFYYINQLNYTNIFRSILGPDYSMRLIYDRANIIFANSHSSLLQQRPVLPSVVHIAGIHVQEVGVIPDDILNFIDNAEHGVIFFSFGSTVKASTFPLHILNAFRDAFSQIPQKVIWRIDDPSVINETSDNVLINKWFPQRDILNHKNVRIFISQGGLQSAMEAIHTATPMILFPIISDQFVNALHLQEKGCGIMVENILDVDKQLILNLIKQISVGSYQNNMNKLCQLFKDRPLSPADEAAYWINYVVKYQGARHLQSISRTMPFYQYFLLDVMLFTVVLLCAITFLIIYVSCKLKKLIS